MNSLLHGERDDEIEDMHAHRDREITLGTTTILGIFFALAILCAGFFGFGYSIGHRSAPAGTALQTAASSSTPFTLFKPSAASPIGTPTPPPQPPASALTVPLNPASAAAANPDPHPVTDADFEQPAAPAPRPLAAAPPIAAAPPTPVAGPAAPGQFMVQVAAVSHPEDADLLVTTLKRRGYAVAVHHEPQDQLLHVQVGPFTARKDADAMRLRLQADGFNAIVK